ncbi:MAG: Cof-type HAD-IIB family hydrolase [Agathobacter sp.]|nr:Cof-type HAD-IIB family hydrolase [Agathobacter sp.]
MSKYVFFDIDGTLWDESMIVPESTKLAIKKLQENGHKAFICTGRSMGSVNDPQFDEIGFDGFIAGCGNYIEMDGKVLYDRKMSYEDVQEIYDVSRKYHMPIIFEGAKYQWLDREGFDGDAYIDYILEKLKDISFFLDECDLKDIVANKFSSLIHENTNYPAVVDALSDRFDFMDHGSGVIEAVPKGTSKATGITWLCEHLNISQEDTYALGDGVNDLEMLGLVGHSIAMGNANPLAKEAAEYVTTHILEDGVWNALKHYGLI